MNKQRKPGQTTASDSQEKWGSNTALSEDTRWCQRQFLSTSSLYFHTGVTGMRSQRREIRWERGFGHPRQYTPGPQQRGQGPASETSSAEDEERHESATSVEKEVMQTGGICKHLSFWLLGSQMGLGNHVLTLSSRNDNSGAVVKCKICKSPPCIHYSQREQRTSWSLFQSLSILYTQQVFGGFAHQKVDRNGMWWVNAPVPLRNSNILYLFQMDLS